MPACGLNYLVAMTREDMAHGVRRECDSTIGSVWAQCRDEGVGRRAKINPLDVLAACLAGKNIGEHRGTVCRSMTRLSIPKLLRIPAITHVVV